jgi:phosphorylcholine metabolism protein LicD
MCGIPYRLGDILYGQYTKLTKKLGNGEQPSKLLLFFDDVMKEAGIPYWLSEGTALGVTREGRLLPWDDDIDTSFFEDYRDTFVKLVIPILEQNGFTIVHVNNKGNFFSFIDKVGNRLDVDIVSKKGNCTAPRTTYTNWNTSCDDMMKHIQYFKNVPFLGRTFTVPNETYLEYLYGKDWKTPRNKN